MRRMPLFPLPVVLFPGARMPLHIFEPRYRRMLEQCLAGDRRFGLLRHDCDERGPFLLEDGRVGCVAEIDKHQPLPDGRSLILVRGLERFRLVDGIETDAPWYEGLVERFCDTTRPHPAAIQRVRARTLELFLAVLGSFPEPPDEVPAFDLDRELSFQLAPTIQIDQRWQQSLLELQDEVYRLERLDAVFQAAIDCGRMGGEGAA
jgi:ATP-dependent Lon protease